MKHNIFEQNYNDGSAIDSLNLDREPRNNCFSEFLVNAGLYERIELSEDNYSDLIDLIDGKCRLSVYCPKCKERRVFVMQPIIVPFPNWKIQQYTNVDIVMVPLADRLRDRHKERLMNATPTPNSCINPDQQKWSWRMIDADNETRLLTFPFVCTMNPTHMLDYVVITESNSLIKIGQWPSVADLSYSELDEFKKVIDEESRKELRRAIGLHAQGIGVGSYVYLRRIFERILNEAKTEAEQDGTIDLSDYDRKKVVDRIRLLKNYLPKIINDNCVFYGIVSKGIHELSEDECISYFPVLKEAIIMILRQWAQKKQEQEDAKKLSASLSKIATQVNS